MNDLLTRWNTLTRGEQCLAAAIIGQGRAPAHEDEALAVQIAAQVTGALDAERAFDFVRLYIERQQQK